MMSKKLMLSALLPVFVAGCGIPGTNTPAKGDGSDTYSVGGDVSGLSRVGLELQNNGDDNLLVSASGSFTFSTAVDDGSAYVVTISSQPSGQMCTVTNGSGTISGSNITNVSVICEAAPLMEGQSGPYGPTSPSGYFFNIKASNSTTLSENMRVSAYIWGGDGRPYRSVDVFFVDDFNNSQVGTFADVNEAHVYIDDVWVSGTVAVSVEDTVGSVTWVEVEP